MKCPRCNSQRVTKNGLRRRKQCYKCRDCGRQFVESPIERSYPPEVRQLCLKMYLNGMGLRGIERVIEIHHTTVMNWIKEEGIKLPDAPDGEEIPEITEIDELQTFIGNKKNKVWVWTVVNHWKPGILLWTVGDRLNPYSFSNADIFNGDDTKYARKVCPQNLWKIARRKLDQLDFAASLNDLRSPPKNRLEALKGSLEGKHSIRINDQYRICFIWSNDGIKDVEIVDYH